MVLSFQADTDSIVSGCVESTPSAYRPTHGGILGDGVQGAPYGLGPPAHGEGHP